MGLTIRNISVDGLLRTTVTSGPTPPPPPPPPPPFTAYTSMLLYGTGTNNTNNNVFVDSSTNNFAITRAGNATQGSYSPFSTASGYWSNYFDGNGDSISPSSDQAFNLTGDFTIEAWVYVMSGQTQQGLINFGPHETLAISLNRTGIGDTYVYIGNGSSWLALPAINSNNASQNLTLNTWNHVALVRNNSVITLYHNGVNAGTTNLLPSGMNGSCRIGALIQQIEFLKGYISNFRIVKGTAVYTGNFTPSTAPLTAISGTSLLTCQSNSFVDNSANGFGLTTVGNTSVSTFSPFNPASSYNAATMGGSMLFNGTGGLTTDDAALAIGTGDFTLEMWFNTTSPASTQALFDTRSPDATTGFNLYTANYSTSSIIAVGTYGSNWIAPLDVLISGNTWYHVALTRSGSSMKLFLNGVQIGATYTSTENLSNTATRIAQGLNGNFRGYISNLRLVKGTAVYTTNFTPPTAPVTAISGTSLLLNGTNGAIYDATGKNDLETVGTAKVSTAISAGGSMLFDGSGNLSVPNSDAFNFGSGDFTIEFYVNVTNRNVTGSIVSFGWPSGNPWLVYLNGSAQTIIFYASSANGNWTIADGNNGTITSVTENTWYHIAISRSGSSIRTFANGTLVNTITSSAAIVSSSSTLTVGGGDDNSQRTQCYVEDLIITKGQAKYTSSFTPPARS